MIIGQDESADAGLCRDLGRDRAHARRQNGRHVARALGLDQLGLADRLAGGERRARDRACELVDGVRPIVLADEGRSGGGGRPGLPAQVLRRDRRAEADIGIGDQNVDGFELRDRCRGRRGLIRAAGKQCGDAAGGEGDAKHDDTRGFHTLHFPLITLRPVTWPQLPHDAPTERGRAG